ncbi:PTS glucitol/sorbitol transporter subunit IIA [Selenomonas sp.]|jgi:sorbitol PTS enzyme IIA component|uniref:PTS glucitol/sorbitol transporter subunit IIA n=1 Tax=Selenomonas sp. TaxID=2053611 RepID=UPI001CB033EE|nr:PTS glucitol/sorbitol transporter subunit IIA [Selenomonas sp.]MBF1693306.1 PTS glucitol/sorbitol transporter subunit IIA [Selenomonas sp.]
MKFYCEITSIGEESLLFLDDPNANFIIIFNNNAPEELAEFSVLHTPANYNADPVVGDTLIIGDKAFTITAIGDEALHTLRELGHCTLSFKGGDTPERPGCIMLQGDAPLVKDDIKMGVTIEIH